MEARIRKVKIMKVYNGGNLNIDEVELHICCHKSKKKWRSRISTRSNKVEYVSFIIEGE